MLILGLAKVTVATDNVFDVVFKFALLVTLTFMLYVPLFNPLNVYVLLVCFAFHVVPLSILNSYPLIPLSLSVAFATTVILLVVTVPFVSIYFG